MGMDMAALAIKEMEQRFFLALNRQTGWAATIPTKCYFTRVIQAVV
jgi:hypothetical protein